MDIPAEISIEPISDRASIRRTIDPLTTPRDAQSRLQFARVDLHAGQKGRAQDRFSTDDEISKIVERAANDAIVTLSIIPAAPHRFL